MLNSMRAAKGVCTRMSGSEENKRQRQVNIKCQKMSEEERRGRFGGIGGRVTGPSGERLFGGRAAAWSRRRKSVDHI